MTAQEKGMVWVSVPGEFHSISFSQAVIEQTEKNCSLKELTNQSQG